MKKVIILSAVILTSGLAALSLNKKESKIEPLKVKIEKSDFAKSNFQGRKADLATAD